jgi:ribosome-binding protein aMBF1 (putative translation factor)
MLLSHHLKPCQFHRVMFRQIFRLVPSGHIVYSNGQIMSRQPTDIKRRVAVNIQRAMAEREITSAELARRLGDHERQVRRWRNGEVSPRPESFARLAMELDREPSWFYMDHEEKAAA